MKQRAMTIPEIILIAGTRAAFGLGVGLLIAEKLNRDTRKGAAFALLAVGALSTIPIVAGILTKPPLAAAPESV
jgi:hypothetical protein